tara:strand:- start:1008 stop:1700 length:693 start_codon:yes stop_codon:yes gene_type:complete
MDLKNIDLKNIKIEDLKEKILQLADRKTLIKIGISSGAIILFLIIYYAILNPIVEKKKAQIDDMNKKKQETVKFVQEIKVTNKKIKNLKPKYDEYSTLFHTKAEVEGLYETLSYYAGLNDLVISKIEKKAPKAVTKAEALEKADGKKKKKKKKKKKIKQKKAENMAYYTIPVNFEITGNFLGYIKFKRALSMSKKMLNFDKESIKVVRGDTTGAIKVDGLLTIVGLGDGF